MPSDLEQLKRKYLSVLNQIQRLGVRLTQVDIQDDKLYIEGVCDAEAIKNRIWDQAKLVDPSYSDLTLNLTIDPSLAPKQQKYTVAAGDSLTKIAKHFYGDANAYMKIFEANKDRLTDPNAIKVGQELVIPN